jgi:ribosomal protein S5
MENENRTRQKSKPKEIKNIKTNFKTKTEFINIKYKNKMVTGGKFIATQFLFY